LGNASLEFGEFFVQLINSFFEIGEILGFKLGGVIDSIDYLNSEFVQFVDDFSEHALVREVLL
jgi:hypothetical protein